MTIVQQLKQYGWYFIGVMAMALMAILFWLLEGKSQSFLWLNQYHHPILDKLFVKITHFGDGIFAAAISVALIMVGKKKIGLSLLLAYLSSGIITQSLKRILPMPRPQLFFEPGTYQHFIDGITFSGNNSFPSAHTTTIFAMITVLVVCFKLTKWQLELMLLAGLVGFSRIYLGQHFLLDVTIGALIGTIMGMLSVQLVTAGVSSFQLRWLNATTNIIQTNYSNTQSVSLK
jgi:membrane-associated phospholipid phosphatase